VTLPGIHAPDRDVDGSPATHNHPLGRRFPPGPGASPFPSWSTSPPDRIRSINPVGLHNDSPPPNRSSSRSLEVVVGAQHLPVPRWESRAHQQPARTFGLRDTPDGPGQSCYPRWPQAEPGSRGSWSIFGCRAVVSFNCRRQAGAATPGRSSPASGFAVCALEDPAAAQRRHRRDEP
jgi:hypothetical protein